MVGKLYWWEEILSFKLQSSTSQVFGNGQGVWLNVKKMKEDIAIINLATTCSM
jgi:hypothetical protein